MPPDNFAPWATDTALKKLYGHSGVWDAIADGNSLAQTVGSSAERAARDGVLAPAAADWFAPCLS